MPTPFSRRRPWWAALLAVFLLVALPGCVTTETVEAPAPGLDAPPPARPINLNRTDGQFYVVREGDSLARLAERFYGDEGEWKRIRDANPNVNPNYIFPGMQLFIPNR